VMVLEKSIEFLALDVGRIRLRKGASLANYLLCSIRPDQSIEPR